MLTLRINSKNPMPLNGNGNIQQEGENTQLFAQNGEPSNSNNTLEQQAQFMLNGCYGNIGRTNFAIQEILGLASAASIPQMSLPSGMPTGTSIANYFIPATNYCQSLDPIPSINNQSSGAINCGQNLFNGFEFMPAIQHEFSGDYSSVNNNSRANIGDF